MTLRPAVPVVAGPDPDRSAPPSPPAHRRWDPLPLGTSLAVHLGVLTVGLLAYQATRPTPPAAAVASGTFVAGPSAAVRPVGLTRPVAGLDAVAPAAEAMPASPDTSPAPFVAGSTVATPFGMTTDPGLGLHTGSTLGRAGAPWRMPGGTGNGPGGTGLFPLPPGGDGMSDLPRRVVYLCDASGSMLPSFARLKAELRSAIGGLDVADRFDVIFFADGRPTGVFHGELRVATPANKSLAYAAIDDAVAAGGTEPLPAIRQALAERPGVLFVLTDGFDQMADPTAVVAAFRRDNAGAAVQCILLQSNDVDPKLEGVLRAVAAENHGSLRVIPKDEF